MKYKISITKAIGMKNIRIIDIKMIEIEMIGKKVKNIMMIDIEIEKILMIEKIKAKIDIEKKNIQIERLNIQIQTDRIIIKERKNQNIIKNIECLYINFI